MLLRDSFGKKKKKTRMRALWQQLLSVNIIWENYKSQFEFYYLDHSMNIMGSIH